MPAPSERTRSITIPILTLIRQVDPDFEKENRKVIEYEPSKRKKPFVGNPRNRWPYGG